MTSRSDDSPSISPAEFAKHFGISRDTVYRWIDEGRLKPARIGPRVWRFRPSQVAAFTVERTQFVHIDEKPGTAWAKKETMQ